MNKQTIIASLINNYDSFVKYINNLTLEEYLFSYEQKWTAGQQLEHIVLCVKPLVQVFSMDKLAIEQYFGRVDRLSRTYDNLLDDYIEKLKEGGEAPKQYVPEKTLQHQKEILSKTLTKMVKELCSKIETFNDQELDSLLIPHPLLKNITLREMLCNAIYHVNHHQELAKENLKK